MRPWPFILQSVAVILAWQPVQAETTIIERGPHSRVIQTVLPEIDPARRTAFRTNRFTQLTSGLHYFSNGQWNDTQELIEIVDGVPLARQGPHRVIFGNPTREDAVDLALPNDSGRMRSHVAGLMYIDRQTGGSVPLAAVRNREATLVAPNQLYYLDVFEGGGFIADLVYTYTRAGLSQVVRFRGAPAPPAAYDLNAESTTLAVVTAFVETPAPVVRQVVLRGEGLTDSRLDFGPMQMTVGRAFAAAGGEGDFVPVAKEWSVDPEPPGWAYLTEHVRYLSVEPYLRDLPQAQVGIDRPRAKVQRLAQAFPRSPQAGDSVSVEVALSRPVPPEGFVIDYVPPLSRAETEDEDDDGDAGDPVLAVDVTSEVVYLVGTSPRNEGFYGIPVWKSIDSGVSFADPIIVLESIDKSDKPWIAVDNFGGTGQHDVYVTCLGNLGSGTDLTNGLWFTVSTDGSGEEWSDPVPIRQMDPPEVGALHSPIVLPGPGHTNYAFWYERSGTTHPAITNWIKVRQILDRGETLENVSTVVQLTTTHLDNNLELKRSNSADESDTFRVFPTPVPAVNPMKANHVYLAYADKGVSATDRADVFFTWSTNGGTTWTNLGRIHTDSTTNDQWMPALAVKPDGTQLLLSWYDRRNDTNNSLIDLYGSFATISTDGAVEFDTEFRITTSNFPPVFAGTLTNDLVDGDYDPVYPPGGFYLDWHYPEWPEFLPSPGTYSAHVGEYNGAWTAGSYVYLTWTDYRLPSVGTLTNRHQSDIRFVRLSWP